MMEAGAMTGAERNRAFGFAASLAGAVLLIVAFVVPAGGVEEADPFIAVAVLGPAAALVCFGWLFPAKITSTSPGSGGTGRGGIDRARVDDPRAN
jgi:hypothetical protein